MVPITLLEAATELPIPVWGFFAIPFTIFLLALGLLLAFGNSRPHSK